MYENYTRGGRYYYFIPLIFILWSNLHGGYVIGLILLGAWIVGELINVLLAFSLPSDERQTEISRASKHAGQIFIWAVIGGAATIINPNGIRIWLVPFQGITRFNSGMGISQFS